MGGLAVPGGGGPHLRGGHGAVVLVVRVGGQQTSLPGHLESVPLHPLRSVRLPSHAERLRCRRRQI